MSIYYFIHLTGTDLGISGIPRVVKNLGRELFSRSNLNVVPVCWSRRLGAIVHAEQKLLDNFARHGGPKLQQSSQARQPIAPEPGEWLLFAEAPHLHSYDREYSSISIDEPIGYARRFGLKVAALIHDLLPLTHQNGRAGRRMFVDMAADGGRSDGTELERLRVTVYAHALALCDIVLPVSRTTGELLTRWLIEHGRRAELLPPISPVLLPEEIVGAPRAIPHATSAPEGSPTEFLAVGTVCAHKNQLAAMSAFQRLAERRDDLNIRLHVVGAVTPDSAVPASLMAKRARGRIILHGHLPDDELEALTSQARASVFVSLAEGYGLPVAESLWRGKPCLCSGEGSIAEIAQGGGCLEVDPRNLDQIEAGLETLATDSSRYSELTHEIATRRMKSWKEYADEIIQKLIACSLGEPMRPEAREGLVESAQTSPVSDQTAGAATSDDRGADEGSRQAIFMVSASDLTVHQAYRSGRARSIYYNSAIRFDRAQDGVVPQKTLFFGPYAQLPAGRYAFRFDGEIDGEIDLAFTANSGARQIARFEVTSFAEPVVVELSAPVEKFEIVGAKTPTLKHLVLRGAFAEFRGSSASADDEAAAQCNADSDAEAGKGPEPAPSGSAAIAEAEQEDPSAQPKAAPRAEELAPARDADGNALSLPFTLPADKLSVHDAYGAGSQNRLRAGPTISFDSETHADVAESRLFYGPYLHLEPGDYSFQFRGALDGSLKLRFTKAFGAECLREVVVTDFEAPVRVPVEAAADNVEIVGVREGKTKAMTLSSIELAVDPLTSRSQPSSDAEAKASL
jgi:glycosyltransferase involved in cell wall biosynthesis